MSIEITLALLGTPVVRELLKSAYNMIASQISNNFPLILTSEETPKLTSPDRRLSMGITKRDGKIAMALLVEKEETIAYRKAENLNTAAGDGVIYFVTGVAHSSRVDEGIPPSFEYSVGASVGHIRGHPGSVGCLVKRKSRGKDFKCLTSAAHVLSMLNRAKKFDHIISPGHPDGPRTLDNKVGELADFTFLNHYSDEDKFANLLNHEDIAAVTLADPDQWPEANFVPIPNTPSKYKKIADIVEKPQILTYLGGKVFKVGRTSKLTSGTFEVADIQQTPIKLPDGRVYIYRDLLAIQGDNNALFSSPGDSGALVYTEDFKALGFVVGGSETITYVSPAAQCLKSVNATLV